MRTILPHRWGGLQPAEDFSPTDDIQSDIIGTMRYVLDTCVVVSALLSRNGASNQVLRMALQGEIPCVCHYKLLSEYRDVLFRMVRRKALVFSQAQVESLLAALVTIAEEVEVRYLWRPNLRDEADNFVYEAAFAASPATIVTHNVRDFRKPEIQWPAVLVKTPQQILTEVSRNAQTKKLPIKDR